MIGEREARASIKKVDELQIELERWRIRTETRRALFGHLSVTTIVEENEKLMKRVTELEILISELMEDNNDFED